MTMKPSCFGRDDECVRDAGKKQIPCAMNGALGCDGLVRVVGEDVRESERAVEDDARHCDEVDAEGG